MTPHRSIRIAKQTDVSFIVQLQKTWSNNVGFLPKCAFERYIEARQILAVTENGDLAGYLIWTFRKDGLVRLPQVAIEPELLRTTLGTRLMHRIESAARAGDCSVIRLTSRSDLHANTFWPELGFILTATLARPSHRGLPLLEWTKQILPTTELARILTAGKRAQRLYKRRTAPRVAHDKLETLNA